MWNADLVRLATEELGGTSTGAMRTTVGQLRLALREHCRALRDPGTSLPIGLPRMKLDELKIEATQRPISCRLSRNESRHGRC